MRLAHALQEAGEELVADRGKRVDAGGHDRLLVLPQAEVVMRAAGAFPAGRLKAGHEGGHEAALCAQFLQMHLGAHGVVGRLDRRLRRQREFVHAVAIFGDEGSHADAQRFHAVHELGHEILIVAAAHQIVVHQRMAPGLQFAVAALLHQRFVDMEDAELVFERHLGGIALRTQARIRLLEYVARVQHAGGAVQHVTGGDHRGGVRTPAMVPDRRRVGHGLDIGVAVALMRDRRGKDGVAGRLPVAMRDAVENTVERIAGSGELERRDLRTKAAGHIDHVALQKLHPRRLEPLVLRFIRGRVGRRLLG